MADDPIQQIWKILLDKANAQPNVKEQELMLQLREELRHNPILANKLRHNSQMKQINKGNATAFQVSVEGGIVVIGNSIDPNSLKSSLFSLLREIVNEQEFSEKHFKQAEALNPYKGLLPFQEEDSALFFGRDSFIYELQQAINRQSQVVIIGASGSGKSSVISAGLIPRLRKENWLIQVFRASSDDPIHRNPFKSLAHVILPDLEHQMSKSAQIEEVPRLVALLQEGKLSEIIQRMLRDRPNSHRFLLVADQFEELLYVDNDPQQQQFIDLLLKTREEIPEKFKLILSFRADYLGNALLYPPSKKLLLNQHKFSVLEAMTPEELRSAIEKPAEIQHIQIEAGLTNRILEEIEQEPGNLPLLEFALAELWKQRSQGRLTHAGYDKIGGVTKALAIKAEANYNQFNHSEKLQVQQIFIQLIRPDEEAKYTRRLATREQIGQENWNLVTRLASQRLVVTSRDNISEIETVELVHEALIQKWNRLHQWMDENRDFRTWQRHLRSAQEQWEANAKDDGALFRGALLSVAEDWLKKRPMEISPSEQLFIKVSAKVRNRSRKLTTQSLIGFSVISFILASIAGWGWINAERQRRIAKAEQSSLLALRQLTMSPIDALIFAMEAGQELKNLTNDSFSAEDYPTIHPILALQTILDQIRLQNKIDTFQKGVNSITFNPDQSLMATAGKDGKIKLWKRDGTISEEIIAYPENTEINSVRFSSDGNKLATAGENGIAKVWNTQKRKLLYEIPAHQGSAVRNIRFGNKSNLLVTSGKDGTVKLWNENGKLQKELIDFKNGIKSAHQSGIEVVNIYKDDNFLLTGSRDKLAKLWNLNGNLLAKFIGHTKTVKSAKFFDLDESPDKLKIITAGEDDTIRIWNRNGEEIQSFKGHQKGINAVDFYSKQIITAGNDGKIKIWNHQGNNITEFQAHEGKIETIRVNEKDNTLVTAGQQDGAVKLWKLPERREIRLTHEKSVNSVRFSPDGQRIVTASSDGTIGLWDLKGTKLETFPESGSIGGGIESVRFTGQGNRLVAGGERDSKVRIWDLKTKELLQELDTSQGGIHSVNLNSLDTILSTTGYDKSVKLWDLKGKSIRHIKTFMHQEKLKTMRFSLNGELAAVAGENGMVRIWNITEEKSWDLKGHQGTVNSLSFSSIENLLATVGEDQIVRLWSMSQSKSISPKTFKTFSGTLQSVNFSPDGKLLATSTSSTEGGRIQFWTLSGQQLADFKIHSQKVRSADFSRDGLWFATASEDKTAIISKVRTLDNLLKEGCSWLRDYLDTHADDQEKLPICSASNILNKAKSKK